MSAPACPRGHATTPTRHNVIWCCDGCKVTYQANTLSSSRCQPCDWDLCERCSGVSGGGGGYPPQQQNQYGYQNNYQQPPQQYGGYPQQQYQQPQQQQQQQQPPPSSSNNTTNTTGGGGHGVIHNGVLYPTSNANVNARCNKGHPLSILVHTNMPWRCDDCGTIFDQSKCDFVAAMTCEPCDFDICPNCAEKKAGPSPQTQIQQAPSAVSSGLPLGTKCPSGQHLLVETQSDVRFCCDFCKVIIDVFSRSGVLTGRCVSCDFDVCQRCWTKLPGGGSGGGATPTPSSSVVPHFNPTPMHKPPSTTINNHPNSPSNHSTTPSGRMRSLFIGINYTGSKAALRGCVNDVATMIALLNKLGYNTQDKRVLVDDPSYARRNGDPTKAAILDSLKWLVDGAQAGDTLFLHYSGHGTQLRDQDGDEDDGYDEALVPLDYERHGMIRDDDIFSIVCKNLPTGARLTAVTDCCHSGTLMDLEFQWAPDTAGGGANPRRRRRDLSRGFTASSKKHCAADVILFSGCKDTQTSADVSSTTQFHHNLPGPGGAGGACTNALAEVVMGELGASGGTAVNITYVALLEKMQRVLKARSFEQIPQLSTSREIDLGHLFMLTGEI